MRLIDLDQIEYFTLVDKMGVPRYKIEIGEDIGIEEVKAIPIEWIVNKWAKKFWKVKNGIKYYTGDGYDTVWDMIEDWEKENGTI